MENERDTFVSTLKKEKINEKIINRINEIERKDFFDPVFSEEIYEVKEIPIGFGQKSENPVMLAKMIQFLDPQEDWNILEVGTGTGFSTAILAGFVNSVVTIEYHEELALKAKENLLNCHIDNVKFFAGDATDMKVDIGQFDAIIIFAACQNPPFSLLNTLEDNGTMVLPLGPPHQQQIAVYTKIIDSKDEMKNYKFADFCVFDSIRGPYGWVDIEPEPDAPDENRTTNSEIKETG